MRKINFSLIAVILSFFACNQQQGKNAIVSEAKDVQEIAAEAVEYKINTENTLVTWIGSKPAGKHSGTIGVANGNLLVEDSKIVGGTVTLDMDDLTSIDLADDENKAGKLIGHLKSPDFFDVANFPQAKLTITSVEAYDAADSIEVKEEFDSEFKPAAANEFIVENPTHKVTGNLTLRDTTLSIAFPAKVTLEGGKITAEAKFNIDRTLWGVMYRDEASVADKAKDQFIYNTVNIGLSLEANRSAESSEM